MLGADALVLLWQVPMLCRSQDGAVRQVIHIAPEQIHAHQLADALHRLAGVPLSSASSSGRAGQNGAQPGSQQLQGKAQQADGARGVSPAAQGESPPISQCKM